MLPWFGAAACKGLVYSRRFRTPNVSQKETKGTKPGRSSRLYGRRLSAGRLPKERRPADKPLDGFDTLTAGMLGA